VAVLLFEQTQINARRDAHKKLLRGYWMGVRVPLRFWLRTLRIRTKDSKGLNILDGDCRLLAAFANSTICRRNRITIGGGTILGVDMTTWNLNTIALHVIGKNEIAVFIESEQKGRRVQFIRCDKVGR
jgi:hypothetical protein